MERTETNYDTRLAVYTGGPDGWALVACNDDLPDCTVLGQAGFDLLSTVSVDVDCGATYGIRLGGYPGAASTGSGTGRLVVACLEGQPCPACPSHLDHSGIVDAADRVGDLDSDNDTDAADIARLLGNWGSSDQNSDIDADGIVGASDLALLLGGWGPCP